MERNRRNPSFKKRPNPNINRGGNKRGRFSEQSSSSSKAPETVYKILCQSRKIGSVLGKGGGIVKALREETQAKITVSETVPGSEERVITISSPSSLPVKSNTGDNQENNDMELYCAAQDALLKVHDRIIEEDVAGENPIMARLLVPNNTVGCVLGKKGDVIQRLRSETGASIRVMPGDQRPACAMTTDELVQISAKPDVAKRALYQVSTLLHQNPRKDKPPSVKGGQNTTPTNVMRAKIGGVIGQGGSNVWQLQQATGTNIHVDDASVESDERVIRVSAFEALRNPRSQTIDAVLNLQDKMSEPNEKRVITITTRLLIPSSKVGCIIGQGGQVINEMRRRTKADIRVFPKEEKPKCAGEDEELVQVSGSYNSAKDAVSEIALRYRARCLRDAKPGTEPSSAGPIPGFVPVRNFICEGPSPFGVTRGGPSLGYEHFQGGGREYEPLSYPAPSTEYRPHGYPVPPRASGYPGAVDVKISNSGQVSGLGPGVHNINEVPGTALKPQDPYAVGAEPASDILGPNAIHGVNVYQGYGGSSVQNHPLNPTYNNYGTQLGPFSDMNSSSHTSYPTTTPTATIAAAAAAAAITNLHQPPYPPQQGSYPESSYQYGH
ncbi:putative K domain-containing protein [Helianthus annuus]|nr:putative K domain-containing protein [Helianthus annuus]KAJ0542863.1 putative K domain-containing protein [Helianthus annuus]KAJ0707919.1 putative K domain-containing protein [Helianthus annuus]